MKRKKGVHEVLLKFLIWRAFEKAMDNYNPTSSFRENQLLKKGVENFETQKSERKSGQTYEKGHHGFTGSPFNKLLNEHWVINQTSTLRET